MTQPSNVAPNWSSKLPADMTDEELKAARAVQSEALGAAQRETAVLSLAVNHITAEVGARFGFDIPGYPSAANLAPYPQEDIHTRFPNG